MSGLSILIVDDDPDFADGLAEVMELQGHRADVACTCEGGLAMARRGSHGVALIDIGLPDRNGVECLRGLRELAPDMVCFLMTGYSADHIAAQGIEAGALRVLNKPVDLEDLLRALAEVPPG